MEETIHLPSLVSQDHSSGRTSTSISRLPSDSRHIYPFRLPLKNIKPEPWQRFFNNDQRTANPSKKNSRDSTNLTSRKEFSDVFRELTQSVGGVDQSDSDLFLPRAIENHIEHLYEQIRDLTFQLYDERFRHKKTREKVDQILSRHIDEQNEKYRTLIEKSRDEHRKELDEQEDFHSKLLDEERRKLSEREEKWKSEMNFLKYLFHFYKTDLHQAHLRELEKENEEKKRRTSMKIFDRRVSKVPSDSSNVGQVNFEGLQKELLLTRMELSQSKSQIVELTKKIKEYEQQNKRKSRRLKRFSKSMQKSHLIRLFEDLSITTTDVEQLNLLERIQLELNNVSSSNEFEEILLDVPWRRFFDLFRQKKNDEIDRILCSIFEQFVANVSIDEIVRQFSSLLINSLDEQNGLSERGKIFSLKIFEKISRRSTNEFFQLFDHRQINAFLRLFLNNDQQNLWLKSKEILEEILRTICRNENDEIFSNFLRNEFFHQENRQILLSTNQQNEIVRLRLYEFLVDLCLIDERIFRHIVIEEKLLEQFLNDCSNRDDDVLYLVNLVELLTSFTEKSHTLIYLQTKTMLIEHFFLLLNNADENPMINLVKPNLIKFFGTFLRNFLLFIETNPTSIESNNEVFNRFIPFVFDLILQSETNSYTTIAFDTIGFIGKTSKGKEYFLREEKFGKFLEKLVQIIRSAQSELRTRALICLGDLFHISTKDRDCPLAERIYTLCNRTWNILTILIQIAKQPFVDLRLASYRCILELSRSSWAINGLKDEPGFLEFLLNRSTEKDKEGKEAKFAIIQTMCEDAEQTKTILGNVNFLKLRRYLNEGIFYVEPEANVAFQGAND